jgi:hypothetical protein
MTDNEIDVAWSRMVAELAADGLVTAKILAKDDLQKATEVMQKRFASAWWPATDRTGQTGATNRRR